MTDLLPPIDPAVIKEESMLNRRWPRNLTARIQSLRRLIAAILSTADQNTGVARLDLAALEVPAALRIDIMRDLVTYNYFLPFAPAKTRRKGRGKASTYGRAGVLAPMLSWLYWEKAAPFTEVVVCVSPPIQRLLSDIKMDIERGDLLNAMRIPGKYPPKLYKFLAAQERWPVTVSIPDLREVLLGSKRGKSSMHQRAVDFMNFGILASIKVINKFSDLRIAAETVFAVENRHRVIQGVTFTLEKIV